MKSLRPLLPYVRPYTRGILLGLVLVVISNAFMIISPRLVGLAIDALDAPGTTSATILLYAAFIVAAALLSGAARFGMRQLLNGISRRVETDLRNAFFGHLLRLDAGFYSRERTGDLMSRATNDIQAIRMAIGPAVMYLVNTVVVTIFALAFMGHISVELTAIALVPMLLLPPAMVFFGRLIHERFERIQEQLGDVSTMVQENLAGARIVRAYTQEAVQAAEFDDLNAEYLQKNMALARVSGLFNPLLAFFAGAGMVVVLWFGGRAVILDRITVGDFVAFGFYLAMLIWPMIALGWVINLFQRGAASMGRINAVMRTEPEVRDPAAPVRLPALRGELEFRNVSFRYPGTDRRVLDGVSFYLPAGQTAALVGPTGAGKSTLIALIVRLYDPEEGEIRLDGVPLQELSLDQLRSAIGLVPQDAFVFSETIGENIGFGVGRGDASRDRLAEAARVARLDEAIAGFPQGYETRLGERGINLSGGQRQRTTLARALARDPRILILDDALSAVDTHTEAEILRGLRDVLERRTALVVSHRVTAVMTADAILVLDDGRIVERGTHAELLEAGGVYATLLRRQLIAEDLEGDELAAAPAGL